MTFNNIRLAFRSIRRRPGLSAVIVVMLAFGIGATTALFSLFYQILRQPLPVPEPERLVNLTAPGPRWGSTSCGLATLVPGRCNYIFSYPMFRDLESRQTTFTGIAAHRPFGGNLGYREQTLSGTGMLVSGQYFSVLNLQPALGRLIGSQDEPQLGESAVVVLTYEYWHTRFGRDPDVVNQTLMVNGVPLRIIGVAPAGFTGTITGTRPQIFVPLSMAWRVRPTAPENFNDRRSYWLYLFARPNAGVSVEQAAASISAVFNGLINEFDAPLNKNMKGDDLQRFLSQQMTLEPGARGQTTINNDTGLALKLLFAVTGLVLLIVCINISNLLLANGASRAGEMAIRASIGGSRRQLTAQLLTESVVLAMIGGLGSLPIAAFTLDLIASMLPIQFANQLGIQLSPEALGFAAAVSLSTVFLFGLLPAFQATRTDPAFAIKEQALQSTGGGRGMSRFRSTLVAAQIAFSTVLLVLAGLFAQSLMNVARVSLGMDTESLIAFSVSPRSNGYTRERTTAVLDRIEEELAVVPGVTMVGSAALPIITGSTANNSISIKGIEPGSDVDTTISRNEVSPGFFKTLSIPLVAGRYFTDADTANASKVAIVNQSFLKKFSIESADALGQTFSGFPYDNVRKVEVEIVGVVADAAYNSVKGPMRAQYYQPRRQTQEPGSATFYVRSGIESDALMRTIPGVVSRIDKSLPVNALKTMRRQIQENVYVDVVVAVLSAGFAGLATLLAAIGLYSVLAYNVAQRTREIGLRLALGAEPVRLRVMVLRHVGLLGLIGTIIGLGAALAIGRTAEGLLFGLSARDPWVLAISITLLAAVVFIAGYMPARRASNISPMEALRYE